MLRVAIAITLLFVPFVSQAGPGADKYIYDCGPAVVSMLIEHYTELTISPDILMGMIGWDRYTHAGELQSMMKHYGLDSKILTFTDIDEVIDASPVIILEYGHWILVTGAIDDMIRYHDSLVGPNQLLNKYTMQRRWLWSVMAYKGIVVTDVRANETWRQLWNLIK